MKIPSDSKVKDITTGFVGFKGAVIPRLEYSNGCVQYFVRPSIDKKTGEAKEGWCYFLYL